VRGKESMKELKDIIDQDFFKGVVFGAHQDMEDCVFIDARPTDPHEIYEGRILKKPVCE
jgi:hypothetical protein